MPVIDFIDKMLIKLMTGRRGKINGYFFMCVLLKIIV